MPGHVFRLEDCQPDVIARTTSDLHPGVQIVISREPHHVKERHATTDIRVSLHDAFEAAEARLRSFAKKQQGKPRQRNRVRLSEAARGPDVTPPKNPRARTRTPPPLPSD